MFSRALTCICTWVVLATAAPAIAASPNGAAVYGGSLGPLSSLLGPDAFYITADGSSSRLSGIGLTYIVACGASGGPLTLHTDRVIAASSLAVGNVPPSNVLVTRATRSGRVSATISEPWPGGGRIELQIAGRLTSRHAAGTLTSRIYGPSDEHTCDGQPLHWRADRRPRRIFGGGIPGAGTVVLTRVGADDLSFHLSVATTDCVNGPSWLVPNIGISGAFGIHDGRFTRPVEDTLPAIGTRVRYLIFGRIGQRRASGTFGGVLSGFTDGRTTWTCRILQGRWSVLSG